MTIPTRKAAVFLAPLAALLLLALAAGDARAQYFGKNKVQYSDFGWRVLETEHFEIYYYESEREAVRDVARMAERSYARLSQVLGYNFDKPIPLILYASHSHFQQTNVTPSQVGEGTGGMTDLAKRRLTIPFTGSYAEMEHVVTHEMVHAFQLDILYGDGGSMLANTVGFSPPLWFMEGMAEYLSIGEVDRHTEMWMRDAALQGYLLSIEDLSRVYDIRVYRFGQSIMNFLARKYGDEKIGEILRSTPRVGGVDRAFQAVLGISLKKFSEEWLEEVRRTYLPQIVDYAKPDKFARPITSPETDRGSLNLVPAVSPSGERVAFISDRDMYSSLYVSPVSDDGRAEKLIEGERTGSFESLRFFNTAISWSPDERYLAFPAKVGGHDAIYIYDMDRRRVHRKLEMEEFDGVLSPSWSPDGTRLVFTVLEGGRSNLFTVRADGKELTRLTDDRYTCRDPAWSPDGKTIAFTTDRGEGTDFERLVFEGYKIALYDIATGRVDVLPNMPGKNIAPQWAPGGEEILFVSDRSGISNVFSMELKTGDAYQLTNILTGVTGIIPESSPISFSRNGETLVFSAFSGGRWDLYDLSDPLRLKHVPFRRKETLGESEPPRIAALAPDPTAPLPPVVAFSGGPDAEPSAASPVRNDAGTMGIAPGTEPAPEKLVDLRSFYPEGEAPEPEELKDHIRNADGVDALPDTADFQDREYKTRFSQDFLFGGAAFASNVGFLGQSAISFSDILGNHNLTFAAGIYGSLSDADLFFSYTNLENRMNWAVALFQYRNDYYIYTAESEAEFESQIYRGLQLMVSRPFSKYARFDFGVRGESITSSVFRTSFYGDAYEEVREDPKYFAQPFVSYVTDNVIYGSTGPINGGRSRLSLDYAFGDLSFGTGILDARKYWNIRRRYSFAGRMLVGTSVGRDLQFFRIGGPYTFRGIDYGDLRATRVGMVNLEFRYPLIERLRFGWPLPLDLRSINGVFFVDGAAGWYGDGSELAPMQNRPIDLVTGRVENAYAFAYGFGARVNLGIFILRWDWGQRTDFQRTLGASQHFFTLAADF
ncbi:MAG: PD40 domain-containing protein [Candidatus Eisenbacteria bacterium]|nr:PD40 domain-containing protein [Candidatus Eisenbacteria bacterium]